MTEGCVEDVCGAPVVRWHRCQEHYQQLLDMGALIVRLTAEERFWTKVDKDGPVPEDQPELGPCWLWTDSPDTNGYGRFFRAHGKPAQSHRYAYELMVGPIPEGLELDHLCRVRPCCRPKHLEAVTREENMHRSWQWRRLKTHCKYGHLLIGENVYGAGRERYCRECATRRKREWKARQKLAG